MLLKADEIFLVRESYAQIRKSPRDFSDLFYFRLHQRYPFTRALFPDDMAEQIDVFRKTVDILVERIDQPDALRTRVDALARRHVGYGVRPKHFAIVGEVLLQTFAELLDDCFTPAMRLAWERLYAEVAATMIRALPED